MTDIQKRLFDLQEEKYRDFSMKLTPSADPDTFIGAQFFFRPDRTRSARA